MCVVHSTPRPGRQSASLPSTLSNIYACHFFPRARERAAPTVSVRRASGAWGATRQIAGLRSEPDRHATRDESRSVCFSCGRAAPAESPREPRTRDTPPLARPHGTRASRCLRFSLKYRVKRGWVQILRGVPFTLYDSTVPYVTPQERFASHTCIASRAMCISGHAPRVPSASPPSSGRGSIAPQDSPATRLTWLGLGLGLGLGLQTLTLTLTP